MDREISLADEGKEAAAGSSAAGSAWGSLSSAEAAAAETSSASAAGAAGASAAGSAAGSASTEASTSAPAAQGRDAGREELLKMRREIQSHISSSEIEVVVIVEAIDPTSSNTFQARASPSCGRRTFLAIDSTTHSRGCDSK